MNTIKAALIDMNPLPGHQHARDIKEIIATVSNLSVDVVEYTSSRVDLSASIRLCEHDIVFMNIPRDFGEIECDLIRILSKEPGRIPVIAMIEDANADQIREVFQLGVVDFLTPPIKAVDVLPRMWRIVEHARKRKSLTERLKETLGLKQIIGTSSAITTEVQKIPFVAGCDSSVLISGETGTGKEMFARAIHYLGPRSCKPFMPVNCGAIPAELIENELFGHARGAFTSAVSSEKGIIQESDGGTLFLDEIDCLTLSSQVKLLRFLQEKEYRQLGSVKMRRADVRIIAATNSDLDLAVTQGRFRRDLYYRLNIMPMTLPPLRKRSSDIPVLARHFVDRYALEFNKDMNDIAPEAVQKLLLYDWPGNVRELQNVIERAVVFSHQSILENRDIDLPSASKDIFTETFQQAKARVVIEFEKNYINDLLSSHRGNITQAAKAAGKNRRAFWELMRKHEIDIGRIRFSD